MQLPSADPVAGTKNGVLQHRWAWNYIGSFIIGPRLPSYLMHNVIQDYRKQRTVNITFAFTL